MRPPIANISETLTRKLTNKVVSNAFNFHRMSSKIYYKAGMLKFSSKAINIFDKPMFNIAEKLPTVKVMRASCKRILSKPKEAALKFVNSADFSEIKASKKIIDSMKKYSNYEDIGKKAKEYYVDVGNIITDAKQKRSVYQGVTKLAKKLGKDYATSAKNNLKKKLKLGVKAGVTYRLAESAGMTPDTAKDITLVVNSMDADLSKVLQKGAIEKIKPEELIQYDSTKSIRENIEAKTSKIKSKVEQVATDFSVSGAMSFALDVTKEVGLKALSIATMSASDIAIKTTGIAEQNITKSIGFSAISAAGSVGYTLTDAAIESAIMAQGKAKTVVEFANSAMASSFADLANKAEKDKKSFSSQAISEMLRTFSEVDSSKQSSTSARVSETVQVLPQETLQKKSAKINPLLNAQITDAKSVSQSLSTTSNNPSSDKGKSR